MGEGMKGEEDGRREQGREGGKTGGGCRSSGALLRGCWKMIAHFSIIYWEEPSDNSEPLFSLKDIITRDNEPGGVIVKALVYLGNSSSCASFSHFLHLLGWSQPP